MKEMFQIEYVLGKVTINTLWRALSTSAGLGSWFADSVDEHDAIFTFHWGKTLQNAKMTLCKTFSHVRFRWEDETDKRTYYELKIVTSELSGDISLIITDFCESDEDQAELTEWWNAKIDALAKSLGIDA